MSCFEIYIDTVRDLFNLDNQQSKSTNLSQWKPMELEVNSLDDVKQLLRLAVSNRVMGATALNEWSSRSHCIHKLGISVIDEQEGCDIAHISGNLVLIDLAGSERINDSRVNG